MDVTEWLRRLGFEQYAAAFLQNDIGEDLLGDLTADDLRELGVTSIGHRRRLLSAIAGLRTSETSAAGIGARAGQDAHRDAPLPERRQVTAIFCDLVGSTELAQRLDLEDQREVISHYQACVVQVVTRLGGFIAKYLGDGVLAYFGYPHAQEDDVEQAVRAGLAVIDVISEPQPVEPLRVRVGLATGLVVVGDLIGAGSAKEQAIVGETPNLAARLQAVAGPNSVIIADGTRRQIGRLFEVEDLGPQLLKGFVEPQRAWRVLSENRALGRFEALRSGSTPLIGRDEELELLLRRWVQVKTGSGRAVLISSEPGVGKSRLAEVLAERIAPDPHIRLRYFCSPHHQDSALFPVITQMERAAGFTSRDAPEERLGKLQALFAATQPPTEDLALIVSLHSLPAAALASGGVALPSEMTPQRKKEMTFEALLRQVERLSRPQPLLMVFEDIHWIDPSSRELLDRTIERIAHWPVLLVATYRPEYQPPWTEQPHVTVLSLARLDQHDSTMMVHNIAGSEPLPPDVIKEITDRTDGVPLFVEELTKAIIESGTQRAAALAAVPHPNLSVPATLHASLIARLDRLGSAAKDIAQVGAVIGRGFAYDVVASIADLPDARLQEALDRLTRSGLLFARGVPPQSSYTFKHALVQDAAYGTLLRGRRQDLHTRLAKTLETQFPETAETQPELLAHHFNEAGLKASAVEWWDKAGNLALQRSANFEAIAHLEQALELSQELEDSAERRLARLRMKISYGNALRVTRGFGAPETKTAFALARDLAGTMDDVPERFSAEYGLWSASFVSGDLTAMRTLSDAFLANIEGRPELPETGIAHRIRGMTCWFAGDFVDARPHLQYALTCYDGARDQALAFRFGQDLAIPAIAYLALTLWPLGIGDEARRLVEETISHALRTKHISTIAYAYLHAAFFETTRRDHLRSGPHIRAYLDLARENVMPLWLAYGAFHEGWLRWHAGDQEEGTSQMYEGLALMREKGQITFMPLFALLLAEAEARAGRHDMALAAVEAELAGIAQNGQRWLLSDAHRVHGELLLKAQSSNAEAAEAAFVRAIEVARGQSAKRFELRAAMRLGRLRADQGKLVEATGLLSLLADGLADSSDIDGLTET